MVWGGSICDSLHFHSVCKYRVTTFRNCSKSSLEFFWRANHADRLQIAIEEDYILDQFYGIHPDLTDQAVHTMQRVVRKT